MANTTQHQRFFYNSDIMGLISLIIGMILVQMALAGVNILCKLAANDGMNSRVIVAYRSISATGFILPLALFLERGRRPKMSLMILFQAFLSGLFGISLAQNLYLDSVALTSTTFASAMFNLSPAITFILTLFFRMERDNFGNLAGKIKILGALMGIGGALVVVLYKGVEINIWPVNIDLLHYNSHDAPSSSSSSSSHIIKSRHRLFGCLLAIASCTCYSLWLIIQAKMSKRYPCRTSRIALISVMGTIINIVYAFCWERKWSQWKLGWNIRLLTVAFTGIVASGIAVVLTAWCLQERGPLFVSAFNPLMLVFDALLGSLLLNEKLHLQIVLASILIVLGLYLLLWGSAKEMKKNTTSQAKIISSVEDLESHDTVKMSSPTHSLQQSNI